MPLTCGCDPGDYDWWFEVAWVDRPMDVLSRRKRCRSCNKLIGVRETCSKYHRFRGPNSTVEEQIYGDEVPLAPQFECETCSDMRENLEALGFDCLTLGENMLELCAEHAELSRDE